MLNQRIDQPRRDAGRTHLARERRRRRERRVRRLARLLGPAGFRRLAAVARSGNETLGMILSAAWPPDANAPRNPARPSLGR
jgi:hypothetical protein